MTSCGGREWWLNKPFSRIKSFSLLTDIMLEFHVLRKKVLIKKTSYCCHHRHLPNGLRRCRSCWGWPGSSRWHRPAAVRGCRAVAVQCRRSPTSRSVDDRWWARASAAQRSRTIRWSMLAAGLVGRIPWSRTIDRWSRCTFAVVQEIVKQKSEKALVWSRWHNKYLCMIRGAFELKQFDLLLKRHFCRDIISSYEPRSEWK